MARVRIGHARRGALTDRQRDYLTRRVLFFLHDGEAFADEEEAAAAWRLHRNELMHADFGSRLRPWGYYKFELNCEPHWWHQEVACLLDRDLISREELFRIEQLFPTLHEGCATKFVSFEDRAWIDLQRYEGALLRRVAEECELAARWHAWRGREELARRFAKRAEIIRQVAAEKDTR